MPVLPDLDAFDRAILAILQKDNTTPQRVIGERVNLSAPAVQRRLGMVVARGKEALGLLGAGRAECRGIKRGQWPAVVRMLVEQEHGLALSVSLLDIYCKTGD